MILPRPALTILGSCQACPCFTVYPVPSCGHPATGAEPRPTGAREDSATMPPWCPEWAGALKGLGEWALRRAAELQKMIETERKAGEQ